MKKVIRNFIIFFLITCTTIWSCFNVEDDFGDTGLRPDANRNVKIIVNNCIGDENSFFADELIFTAAQSNSNESKNLTINQKFLSGLISPYRISEDRYAALPPAIKNIYQNNFQRDENDLPIQIRNEFLLERNPEIDSLLHSQVFPELDHKYQAFYLNEFLYSKTNQLFKNNIIEDFLNENFALPDVKEREFNYVIHSPFWLSEHHLLSDFRHIWDKPDVKGVIGLFNLNQNLNNSLEISPFEYAYLEANFYKNSLIKTGKSLTLGLVGQKQKFIKDEFVAGMFQHEITGYLFTSLGCEEKTIGIQPVFMNVAQQLSDISPLNFTRISGTQKIGVLCSGTLSMGNSKQAISIIAPAVSLLRMGIPVEVINLERITTKDYLSNIKILILSYSEIFPTSEEYHKSLKEWVESGGILVFYDFRLEGNKSDLQGWWRKKYNFNLPQQHLFKALGVQFLKKEEFQRVGKGGIIISGFSNPAIHREKFQGVLKEHLKRAITQINQEGYIFKEQNYLFLTRRQFVVAAVLRNSVNHNSLTVPGNFIDCLDSGLHVIENDFLLPGDVSLLFNIKKIEHINTGVILSNAHILNEKTGDRNLSFDLLGWCDNKSIVLIKIPTLPPEISVTTNDGDEIEYDFEWFARVKIFRLVFMNPGKPVHINLNR